MFQDFLSRFLHCVDVLCDELVLLKTSDSVFGTKTMIIHVYAKTDAPDPPAAVHGQLDIVHYDESIMEGSGGPATVRRES